ncbi:MAG: nucleotidyl transferase AbiEii/AbiGii toxin family protein [Calditrichae bacterium]|nr:nucleotidyl transferase AbiEii/AbiGii toxin family protein [Calditrichia bacterium]
MLQYCTITSQTLELLKDIQSKSLFQELRLAGGTSLALQIGHRVSDDLDLFGLLACKYMFESSVNEL